MNLFEKLKLKLFLFSIMTRENRLFPGKSDQDNVSYSLFSDKNNVSNTLFSDKDNVSYTLFIHICILSVPNFTASPYCI